MSDTVFALAYGACLLLAVAAGLWLKRVTGTPPARRLSFEEIGYLGGGPVRAAEVALAGLVADNRARVSAAAVTAVGGPDPGTATTPLQRVLLTALARPRDLDALLAVAATSAPARNLGRGLVAAGLLVPPRGRLRRALLAVLPLAVVATAGLVRLVLAGADAWGVAGLAVTGALAVVLLLGPPPVLTRQGALAHERATEGLAPVDPAEVTARHGFARPSASERRPEPARVDTAVFDGERVEPIDFPGTSQEPLPRRRRAVVIEPRRWQRRNGWLVAGGWFAGGWLAAELLEGGGDGDHVDFGGFEV
ncbi:TIGR04222 domain-containing membrane protein [Saccharothrix coeruleofusca]|uniref:TIGR04222 domain-containing membrane protein n=1 Tax=Saccharothrix coeruleofusca TaxID=33919 RepID=A0A918AQH3_9PSEU|nr:TIGR04222 domain-containing membrane protein [Saccharothrix coeruleofusca]GGP73228.1 hypothetical protein GCM10010185_53400 [Saccharothrix coeruleofusca]